MRLLFDESLAPGEAVLCFREVDQEKQHQLKQLNLLENALAAAKKAKRRKVFFLVICLTICGRLLMGLSDFAA